MKGNHEKSNNDMKKNIITMLLLAAALTLHAQDKEKALQDAQKGEQKIEIFDDCFRDENPQFKGGAKALREYIEKNLHYPEAAQEKGVEGRVLINFVVEKNGRADSFKVIQSVDPKLDAEALRVVKSIPQKWIAARVRGEPIRVRFTMPIIFKLEKEQVKK